MFCLSFPLDAGSVLCPGFLLGVTGGQTLGRVSSLAEQLVKPECLAARLHGAVLWLLFRLGRVLRWPRAACSDGSLVLTLEGAFYGGGVGFELTPPSGYGRGFASGPGCCCSAGCWDSRRRFSSALALAAVSLVPVVAADHCS